LDQELILKRELFPKTGFAKLSYTPAQANIQKCYRLFDRIVYDDSYCVVDEEISTYIKKSIGLTVDFEQLKDPVVFKNLKHDAIKYQVVTGNTIQHEMISFHYMGGFFEYLMRDKKKNQIPEKAFKFLSLMSELHKESATYLAPLVEKINQKIPCYTSIKIWKHTFGAKDRFLLPLHCDRSIFTSIIHTSDTSRQCLRIYPNKTNMTDLEISTLYRPYPLSKTDFPMIIPGLAAKEHFGIAATPHSVAIEENRKPTRYSLILFIAEVK